MPYSTLWILIGALITIITLYDFYKTTLTARGGGPISRPLAQFIWQVSVKLKKSTGKDRILAGVGPALLAVLLILWFGLTWLGWFLIFCGHQSLVIDDTTGDYASLVARLYYAGYTLTTIGYGNYVSPTSFGQLVSIIGGFNGLVLVTLAITYSIPVLSAAVQKRQLALLIHTLGSNTEEIIDQGNDDGTFSYLACQLQSLNSQIANISYQHLAYPLVHYFHDENLSNALPLNLVRLHEAMAIILFAFPTLPSGRKAQFESTKAIIESLFAHLKPILATRKSQIPSGPECSIINALERSEKSPEDVQTFLETQRGRKLLLAYIQSDGWSWSDVHPKATFAAVPT